jgi:hypothetical protein
MSFPPPITAMKFRVSTGSDTYEQTIPAASQGNNSMQITHQNLLDAFIRQVPGTIFTPSIVTTFNPGTFPSGDTLSIPSVSNFVPNPITATLSLGSIPALNALSSSFSLVPLITKNSIAPLSFSSNNTNVLSVSSAGVVTVNGAGSATITISQPASSDNVFTAAAPITRLVNVDEAAPVLSNFPDIVKNYGDQPFTLNPPTSNSDGEISYTSSDESVATISGNTVTIVGTGTAILRYHEPNARMVTATVIVNPIFPTYGEFNISPKNVGDQPFTLNPPTSNSDGAFIYTSSDESVATISGNTVTIVGTGTTTVIATQAATKNYKPGMVTDLFVVNTN